MMLWEFVLTKDNREDLTAPGVAAEWLHRTRMATLQEAGVAPAMSYDYWLDPHQQVFAETVHALRSLAPRLKGFRGRPSAMQPWQADVLFSKYLGWTCLVPRRVPGQGSDGPLSNRNYAGLKAVANAPFTEDDFRRMYHMGRDEARLFDHLLYLCITAVLSLVVADVEPVCGRCGQDLPPTPKGKPSRAKTCARCRREVWEARLSAKEKRAMWKKAKTAQRAKAKGRPGRPSGG